MSKHRWTVWIWLLSLCVTASGAWGQTLAFIDDFGRETATFPVGANLGVRLIEPASNQYPQYQETIYALELAVTYGPESGGMGTSFYTLNLSETGPNTGVFEGRIQSTAGITGSGGVAATVGGTVTAIRYTPDSPEGILATAAFTGGGVIFVDAQGQPASVYLEGTRAYLRAEDHQSAGPLTVQVSTDLSLDQETVTLQPTFPGSGLFTGSIPLALGNSATPGNGTLETGESFGPPFQYETLRAAYQGSNAQAATLGYRVGFLDASGAVVGSYLQGTRAYVRLEDHNHNNPNLINTLYVQLDSSSGDQEFLQVTETGLATGIYESSIPLDRGAVAAGDGRLQASAGGEITADRQGAWFPAPVHAAIDAARVEFIDDAERKTVELLENGTARLRVTSSEDDLDPASAETVIVQVHSRNANDQENVTLTETGPDTGVFEGSIRLLFNAYSPGPVPGDGVLETGLSPDYDLEETTATFGAYSATARNVLMKLDFVNLRGQAVSTYPVRSTISIRARYALDDAAYLFEYPVTLQSAGLDTEYVKLTETGPGTGVFVGRIDSSEQDTSSGDGILGAPAGQPLEVRAYTQYGAMYVATAIMSDSMAPRANDDAVDVEAGSPAPIDVLANDSSTGGPLSVAQVTQGVHGTVTIDSAGTVTYTAAADYSGFDSFTYVAVDAQGGDSQATVNLTVTFANRPPVANGDVAEIDEDTVTDLDVLANDFDPDGDNLSVQSFSQPQHGSVELVGGNILRYTPNPDYNGTDSFTYEIGDGHFTATATATVSITLRPVNDPPVAIDDTVRPLEDTPTDLDVLANDYDADGDPLVVTSVTQPAHGTAVINPDNTVKYTPAANYDRDDELSYTVSDGTETRTALVTIWIQSVNDPPVVAPMSVTTAEDQAVELGLLLNNATDVDDSLLSVSSFTQGAHGTVVASQPLKYTPAADYNGPDSFTYTVTDGHGGFGTGTVTVTVTPVNDAPVATADSATVAEDGTVNVNVLGNDTDVDGDVLSVASVTQGAHGTVTINADKTAKYAPSADYNGPDSFTYAVSDGKGGTATGTVTITVTPVNDAPTASADSATIPEDGTVDVNVLGNDSDADGDTLSVTSITPASHGTVGINADKTVKYTPAANYNGPDSFTYTVSDGHGGSATGAVTITVTSVNDVPVANADSATIPEDGTVNVNVLGNDSDADGDTLSVTSITPASHGTVGINADKTVKYTPAANYNGPDSFTYTVSDGHGGYATATVAITVTAVNDAPVAVNDSATVAGGSTVTVSVLANDADVDGPGLSVTSVTQGAHGTAVINPDQTVTYTASLYTGTDSFTYTASDGAGGTATATVNVTLTAPARVTSGIQARYDFNEGSGATVNDTSGVGTPLNLTIGSTSAVTWISGGLKINTATPITSSALATKIISAAQASNALTVEAWVTPSSLTLTGPARIATITKNAMQKNLVFGQSGNRYETQLKTSTGMPALQSPASSLTQALTHVVYTRASSGQALWYLNGVQVSNATTTGNLSTWGTDQKLTLSDNWQGSYFLLAVYGRALTASEVRQNYLAGVNAN